MKRLYTLAFGPLAGLVVLAACATSQEETPQPPGDDGGGQPTPESSTPDSGDAADAPVIDADSLRCSEGFCIQDLPNPGTYGFTKWMFAGVEADPVLGIWAIANGVHGQDESTAQFLHFESGAWKVGYAPALGSGGGKRSIELYALASDGAGKLLAVGATLDDETPVLVRGDGTTFTTTIFEGGQLASVWFAAPGDAWAVGPYGGIYHLHDDGSWESESRENSHFEAVWGTGPNDVWVGGIETDRYYGYLGHRTLDEAGAPSWTFVGFEDLQRRIYDDHVLLAGLTVPGGPTFWASPSVLARSKADTDGGDGGDEGGKGEAWIADPFQPRLPIRSFWARSKNDVWAVGHLGRVLHFDGAAWKDTRFLFNGAPVVSALMDVAGTNDGEVFIVGQGVALRRAAQ